MRGVKITKTFEKTTTRYGADLKTTLAWAKGEAEVGLKKSLFICKKGKLVQYVDSAEGERFYEWINNMDETKFYDICCAFIQAIEDKDLEKMHIGLAVFDEMDIHPELGTEYMRILLKKTRENTHDESYKFEGDGVEDFIIFRGVVYMEVGE